MKELSGIDLDGLTRFATGRRITEWQGACAVGSTDLVSVDINSTGTESTCVLKIGSTNLSTTLISRIDGTYQEI